MTGDRLIIFTRYPVPGKAKTRLIPALGAAGAAQLHAQMAAHTLSQARRLQECHGVDLEVRFTGSAVEPMQAWLGADLNYQPQSEGSLGDRLIQAIRTAFDQGSRAIIVIGTDCPELDATLLAQAFQTLQSCDLVLGPASDGGYYLIGLRQPMPALFQGIAWSTNTVLQQTCAIATHHGLAIVQLPTLRDVDEPADLVVLGGEWGVGEWGVGE